MGTISDFVIHQYYIIFVACEMRCCVVNMWNEQSVYHIFIKFFFCKLVYPSIAFYCQKQTFTKEKENQMNIIYLPHCSENNKMTKIKYLKE